MLSFSGEFKVNASPKRVYNFLTNIKEISACLPNLTDLNIKNDEFSAKFKIDVSKASKKLHIGYLSRVTAKMNFKFSNKINEECATIIGNGRVVGNKIYIQISFKLRSDKISTNVHWNADTELGRLLKLFGKELINQISNDIINNVINCIKEKLSN